MKITTTFPGLSLLEVREKYRHLMYEQAWFDSEKFAKDKAPAGIYELRVPDEGYSKTFVQQEKLAKKGEEVAHPAVVLYAIFEHFEKTGERLLEYRWVRTNQRSSDGRLVRVGFFDSGGARVSDDGPDRSGGRLGVCLSRMIGRDMDTETMNPSEAVSRGSVEDRIAALEAFEKKVREILKID